MDDKQTRDDKKLAEEIISDKELDSVVGGSNPAKEDKPNPFKDHSGGQTGHG
ncbi:MAG: bacteriocin [Selenomonadaceae bacterium]|nr:bacteriocin [Selenomonadaceae bacterium]MBR6887778.1 bacteriocin [Selenomonadaceae bacterium]